MARSADVEEVDLSAGAPSVLPTAPPAAPPPTAPPAALPGGGLVSSIGSFTSALFGSPPSAAGHPDPGPAAPPPPAGPARPARLVDDRDDSNFQPVSLEPATGPTPTFYNPDSLLAHGAPPPVTTSPRRTPPAPLVNQVGYGRPFEPLPSDLYFTRARPPGAQPPAIPFFASPAPLAAEHPVSPGDPPSAGSPFATPTGPPPPGPPSGLSFGSSSGSPFATPTGPAPVVGLVAGPPSPSFAASPGLAPPASAPSSLPPGPPPLGQGPAPAGNAFRLGGRRPVYAPVPGLETSFGASARSAPMPSVVMAPAVPPALDTATSMPLIGNGDYYEPQVTMSHDLSPPPTYRTVYQHWFFKSNVEGKVIWHPFSMTDSLALETNFLSPDLTSETEVATDGGRYDVNILRRQRVAVYWEEAPTEVRRCSWFSKSNADGRYAPYDENVAARLEEEYKVAYTQSDWQRRVEFPNGEAVVFHSANVLVHYLSSTSPDAWGNAPVSSIGYSDGTQHRPRVVKRGVDEFDIESGESESVDHILFIVHGVGSACDLKFRTLVEVVDDFRSISQQLVESHFASSVESGEVRRVEVLPVSWHDKLHTEDIETQLRSITLSSIPRFRHLTNDTLVDILFYTSPIYCQTVVDTVAKELNRLYSLFLKRNPSFSGGVSLGGHSLGSLILFDLLGHQKGRQSPSTPTNSSSTPPIDEDAVIDNSEVTEQVAVSPPSPLKRKLSHNISFVMMGPAGTGQPFISYPKLNFHPENFFALGSPIGLFVTVRGIRTLGEDFQLPTCPAFFNIFHPCDLVAYRIESLIRSDMANVPPVLIPHHKGRKRMHLELKETVARMGADLKQKVLDSVKSTWNSVYQLAMFHRSNESLTEEMSQVLENEIKQQSINEESSDTGSDLNITVGKLNGGRRIDYVLQEAPLESFNEYLSSIGSHVCYWKSQDTVLLMLKEMYRSSGVTVDRQVPQQHINPPIAMPSSPSLAPDSMSVYSQPALLEPSPLFPTSSHSGSQQLMGMDPTAPPSDNRIVGPPPVSGFFRK